VEAECATQQDIDDGLVLVASATAEAEALQTDADVAWAQYQDYCANNPQDCSDEDFNERPVGGPSHHMANCFGEFAQFAGASLGTNLAIGGLAIAVLAPAAPLAVIVLAGGAVTAGLFGMLGTGISLYNCKANTVK
jgi:hypothetical protein